MALSLLRDRIEEADMRLGGIIAWRAGHEMKIWPKAQVYNVEQLQNMQSDFNEQIAYLLTEIREQELEYETYINILLQDLQTVVFEKRAIFTFDFQGKKIAILTKKIADLHQEIRDISDLPDIIKNFREKAFGALGMVYNSKEGHVYTLQAHLLELDNELDEILYQSANR